VKQKTITKICNAWKVYDDVDCSFDYQMQMVMDDTGMEFYTIMDGLKAGGVLVPTSEAKEVGQ
jgi:hypothetical protein